MSKSEISSPSLAPTAKPSRRSRLAQWFWGQTRTAQWAHTFLRVILPMLVVAVLGVGVGWAFRTRKLSHAPKSTFQGRRISFDLTLTSVDPLASGGIMAFSWNILEDSCFGVIDDSDDDNNSDDGDDDSSTDPSACPTVNFYMDSNLFAGSTVSPTTTANNSVPETPIFQFIPAAVKDTRSNEPRFETNLAIRTRKHRTYATLLNYPFDQYWADVYIFALVDGTQSPVGLSIGHTDGVAVGYDVTFEFNPKYGYDLDDFNADNLDDGSLYFVMSIRRTVLVRAYAVTLVLAMWLITLLLLAIAIKAAFYGYEVDVTILAAPVATLFAFTTLRGALPGAPGAFGAIIDFVGTLPSLAVLIGIAVLCLMHVLIHSKKKEDSKPQPGSQA